MLSANLDFCTIRYFMFGLTGAKEGTLPPDGGMVRQRSLCLDWTVVAVPGV